MPVRSSDYSNRNFVASLRDAAYDRQIGGRKLGVGAKVGGYQLKQQYISVSSSRPMGRGHMCPAFSLHFRREATPNPNIYTSTS